MVKIDVHITRDRKVRSKMSESCRSMIDTGGLIKETDYCHCYEEDKCECSANEMQGTKS